MVENHNIEDFFKRRIESHEFPFQEEDWLLLESRLGTPGSASAGSFLSNSTIKKIVLAVLSLTLAFFLGWLARDLQIPGSHGQVTTDKSGTHRSEVIVPEKANTPNKTVRSSENISKSSTGMNAAEYNSNPVSNMIIDPAPLAYVKTEEQVAAQENTNELSTLPFQEDIIENLSSVQEDQNKENEVSPLKPKIPNTLTLTTPQSLPDFQIIRGSTTQNPGPSTKMPFRDRWTIGLMIAPDYNSVTMLHNKKASALIGGQLSYSFTHRWSISAGVLYNTKKYSGEAEYYKPPKGYWLRETNGIIPENIAGSCRVIDIPIMATYQFMQKELVSFTASAGMGSYFLLDEKYNFEFGQSNPGAVTHWQTGENTSTFFSIANFALGVEVQTTPRTILAVEPYLKLSLNEIGWGKINLYSLGLLFTVKYRL